MTDPTPHDWSVLLATRCPPGEIGEAVRAVEDMVLLAHVTHPAEWVDVHTFVEEAIARATEGEGPLPARLAALHAADLYLALACANGRREAIELFEREHVARVGDFVARINATKDFADEVRQRLRSRLLTGTAEQPPRIRSYSARGPIGGWLRVCAVREGRELEGAPHASSDEVDRVVAIQDPEIAFLKERYGELVSDAFRRALLAVESEDRTMLRMHYVDGLTLEQVATVFRVSRATGARSLARARARLVEAARRDLQEAIGGDSIAVDSLIAFVRSRIELDLAKHLG